MITLYGYKLFAGITDTKEDNRIQAAVAAAGRFVQEYTGVEVSATDKTVRETFSEDIELPSTNVSSISEVKILETDEVVDPANYMLDGAGLLEFISGEYPTTKRGISITYSIDSELPADLIFASYELVTYYWRREFNVDKTVGGESVEFNEASILPTQVKTILDQHRCL